MTQSTPLTLDAARTMIDRAIARATELGLNVAVAVVDGGGHLVASARMDGASFTTSQIAIGKAWTAAAFRAASGTVAENFAPAPAFASALSVATDGRFTPRQGALPLESGGAIGVSGASSAEDEDIARHASSGAGPSDR